jgi:hypothetical protein
MPFGYIEMQKLRVWHGATAPPPGPQNGVSTYRKGTRISHCETLSHYAVSIGTYPMCCAHTTLWYSNNVAT